MCGTTEILMKNVRYNWNPNEKCAVQLKSLTNLCAILEKTLQKEPNPRDPWKSWRKKLTKWALSPGPPKIPGDPVENLTKRNPYPGPLEILGKTSQNEPHPPRKSWGKPHNITHLLGCCWLVVPTSCAEAPCGAKTTKSYVLPPSSSLLSSPILFQAPRGK